jgi:FdhD protein
MRTSVLTVPIQKIGSAQPMDHDLVAVEEPVQIRVGDTDVAITMRTPGNDIELAAGFLFTEGILHSPDEVRDFVETESSVTVLVRDGVTLDLDSLARHSYLSSSCGVCGKASIDVLAAAGCVSPAADYPRIEAATLHSLPGILRGHQRVFEFTGGLHGCALFTPAGELELSREDVGRHNALDKLVGRAFLDGRLPLSNSVLLLSGRVSFELVQKAVMAGIPVIAAVGAPSSLAVQTARRFGITLAGFVRNGSFNLYSGEGRVSGIGTD